MKVKSESEVAQSCPTLSDPMDCSPPGSSIHGIFQARVLEWGAIAFSFHVLAIVNSAVMNIRVHVSLSILVSLASLTTYILRKYSSIPIVCKLSRNLFCLVLKALFGEGNGNPLQYSCLENPTDGGAWWAAVHGVAKSRTRLK